MDFCRYINENCWYKCLGDNYILVNKNLIISHSSLFKLLLGNDLLQYDLGILLLIIKNYLSCSSKCMVLQMTVWITETLRQYELQHIIINWGAKSELWHDNY